MRIGIDLSCLPQDGNYTGVANYAFHLVGELLKIGERHEWVLFVNTELDSQAFSGNDKSVEVIKLPKKKIPFWSSHVMYARVMQKANLDLLHGVANTVPLLHGRGPSSKRGRSSGRIVVTIHDLAIYKHPEWFPRGQWLATKLVVPQSIKKADRIIVPSQTTANDLKELFGVAEEKIAVVPLGVSQLYFNEFRDVTGGDEHISTVFQKQDGNTIEINGNTLSKKYILFVGTIEPRKNLERLIEAYASLPEEVRGEYDLVIAGKQGWGREAQSVKRKVQSLNLACHSRAIRPRDGRGEGGNLGLKNWIPDQVGDDRNGMVIFLNYVPNQDLPALYRGASVFVYPSLYEGFGLPVLEAMASGVPVVTSKGTAMEELVGGEDGPLKEGRPPISPPISALLVNPLSPWQIGNAILKMIRDKAHSREISAAGMKRAREFTWERTAAQTLKVYESLGK